MYRYPRLGAAKPNEANLSTVKPLTAFVKNAAIQPEEIWLLATNLSVKPGITGNTAAPAKEPEIQTMPEPTAEEQAQLEATLEQASSKNAEERAVALSNLVGGQKDNANIRKVLEEALTDKDANVRTQAIISLMQREGEDAALEVQQALKDKDVNVRIAVLSNVNDTATLQQALADSDPMIRDMAASKLNDLASQQNK